MWGSIFPFCGSGNRQSSGTSVHIVRLSVQRDCGFFVKCLLLWRRLCGGCDEPLNWTVCWWRCSWTQASSRQIVETIEKHSEHFYIHANNCSSLYDCLLALRGWQCKEINGIEYGLNSILTEKWEGKAYRLVIQRQRRAWYCFMIQATVAWYISI